MADDGRSTAAPGADTAGSAPVVTTAVPAAVAAPPWPAATTSPVSPFATAASLAQAAARAGPAPGALGALPTLPTLPTTAAQSFASHASVPERTLKSTLAAAVARHELGTHAAYARVPPLGNDATMKMDRTSGSDAPESASDDDDDDDDDEDAELAAGANRAREHTLTNSDEQIVASGSTPSKTLLPPGVPPPAWMLDAAWANHSPAPMDAAADGVAAAREAWICCDAADCGKWRRVPAVVARALGEGDEWRCSENRDARFAGCRLPQELGDDEIDRRVNAAAAAEREVLLAEAEAERIRARDVEKREKKRKADQLYRDRKRARKAQERRDARVAAGLPPDSPPRPPPAEKKIKAEKKVKAEKPPPAPPPPPPPPTFYPLAAIRCESESCGKWRRVSRAVANANAGPRKRWVCAFNAAAPFEQRSCAFPQEWADDDALRRWRVAHAHEEAEARALGAVIDGEEDPTAARVDSQKAGGKKKSDYLVSKNASAAPRAPRRAPIAAGETEEQARRRRAEAGIKEDLPRGEVSGFAAEAMCAEDEEAHDDPNRKEGAPRTMPPPLPRGEPAAAVPVRCGGVAGVFLTRRAAFRCMCDSALENCASRSGVADGNVMTTTAFERHCGMEKSKNWRTSVAVVCSDRPVGLKIGQWLDEVGVDVARGKGGGPGAESSKESSKKKEKDKHKANERFTNVRAPDTRWQPETPGPMEDLPLRFLMDAIRLAGPGDDDDDDEELSGDEESPRGTTPPRNASRAERRRFLARLCVVSKTWACASKTVTKTSGWDAWRPTGRSLAEMEAERDENANARGEERANAKNGDGSIPKAVDKSSSVDKSFRAPNDANGHEDVSKDPPVVGELEAEAERASLAKREARREKDRERRRREGYVDRKFEVDLTATRAQLEAITEYVPRGDPEEVARERTVTLAPEFAPKVSAFSGKNASGGSRRPPHVAAKHPGDDALDRRVRVFWPEEKAYFLGMVTAFDASTGEHVVTYDDGDVESVVLAKETFEWLEPNGAYVADPSLPSLAPTIDPVTGDVSDPSKPPGWWPVAASWPLDPATGKQQRRKRMGEQVREQETYGVDYVTARDVVQTFKRVCPEWDDDALWRLCDALMAQVNASYGFLPIDTAVTQSLALAAEDKASTLERDGLIEKDGETRAFARAGAKALWALAADARAAPEMFVVHRKGFGVTCADPNGVRKGDLVVDFLGEMYPPWAWAAKQDAIKAAQKLRGMKESGPPEFYNMQLERPAGDAEGFALLFVDAMHHNNYAARLSHSCDPNVEVSLRAIDGKYCINFYAKRDVRVGEELCYNYHSCTDSMKEVEAAFCLCGARRCRASYLAFVGEQSNNQVLTRCHRLVERHAALFSAGDASSITSSCVSPAAIEALESIGLRPGRGLLRDVPDWLVRYVGSLALFMSTELKRLPRDILDEHRASTAKEVRRSGGSWKPPPFGLGDAEIEALSVRENRAQSVAICLSKVRYLLGRGAEEGDEGRVARRKSAPPPFRAASETDFETRAKFFGAHRDALVRVLLQCMAPHARHGDAAAAHAAFAAEVNEVAAKVCGSGHDSDPAPDGETVPPSPNEIVAPTMSLREGLLWLRDRLASMPVTPGARHDIAADLVHLCACTRRRFAASASPSHAAMRGAPVAVRENEVCSFGIGAEGASAKIVKKMDVLYKPHAAAFSLLMWYKQDASDPAQYVNSNRRGCVTLPDVNCAYSPRPEVPVARAGAEERDAWLRLMRTNPGAPWPLSTGPWGVSNAQRLMGSPALDAFVDAHENGWGTLRGGEPATEDENEDPPRIDDATLEWLEKRPTRNAT